MRVNLLLNDQLSAFVVSEAEREAILVPELIRGWIREKRGGAVATKAQPSAPQGKRKAPPAIYAGDIYHGPSVQHVAAWQTAADNEWAMGFTAWLDTVYPRDPATGNRPMPGTVDLDLLRELGTLPSAGDMDL